MDGHPAKEVVDRDLRRRQLAHRLVRHQARTQTISRLTGLSRHQLATLRQRWGVSNEIRPRGPVPKSLAVFHSTARVRSEAAVLAAFLRVLANTADASHGTHVRASGVSFGERLCEVYEAYVACFPAAKVGFEGLALLARGLDKAELIALSNCARCEAAILIDLLGTGRHLCAHCHHAADLGAALSMEKAAPELCQPAQGVGEVVQRELF